MGLAALGNSIVQLAERDKLLGWSTDGLELRLQRQSRQTRQTDARGITSEAIDYLETAEAYERRVGLEAVSIASCLIQAID
jgi:hypothetical protein